MMNGRSPSEHTMCRTLYDSLRKQRQLSNRINVLLQQKEKKLKVIERRIHLSHQEQESRLEKHLKVQKIKQSCQDGKVQQTQNSRFFQQQRRQLQSTIAFKKSQLKQGRRQCYNQMKKHHINNQHKISQKKQKDLQLNQKRKQQVKLMEINSKENIRKYWDERVDCILQTKAKQQEKKHRLFEDSSNNISILEAKEKRLLQQLRGTMDYQHKLKSQPFDVEYIEDRPIITWRSSSDNNDS